MPKNAPYFAELAQEPDHGGAVWLSTSDNIRIRVSEWTCPNAAGTVFILLGRTEYCEKYAEVAKRLNEHQLNVVAIDWRGQGLSDHFGKSHMVGHVNQFRDFQDDLATLLDYAHTQNMPKPWSMLAHSMGGAIGLRHLTEHKDFSSVVFSAPMWGIHMTPTVKLFAPLLAKLLSATKLHDDFALSVSRDSILITQNFADNTLTPIQSSWDLLKSHMIKRPELQLGGPSYAWLSQALQDCDLLSREKSPNTPCLCLLGGNERIVDVKRIQTRMTDWPNGTLKTIPKGEHEVLMDTPDNVAARVKMIAQHFKNTA